MDARDKPIENACHADPVSFIEAPTDTADGIDHMTPYAEDAVFKDASGPVHRTAMNKQNAFWVSK